MSKVLSIYIPMNLDELSFFEKTRYTAIQYAKNYAMNQRAKNEDPRVASHVLAVYTLSGYAEFLRVTTKAEVQALLSGRQLTVELPGEVDVIYVKAGKAMQKWLNDEGITLKIVDIEGKVNEMNKIQTYQFHNEKYI